MRYPAQMSRTSRYMGPLKKNSAIFARAGSFSVGAGHGERNTKACTPA